MWHWNSNGSSSLSNQAVSSSSDQICNFIIHQQLRYRSWFFSSKAKLISLSAVFLFIQIQELSLLRDQRLSGNRRLWHVVSHVRNLHEIWMFSFWYFQIINIYLFSDTQLSQGIQRRHLFHWTFVWCFMCTSIKRYCQEEITFCSQTSQNYCICTLSSHW